MPATIDEAVERSLAIRRFAFQRMRTALTKPTSCSGVNGLSR